MVRGMSRDGVLPKKESLPIERKNVRNSVERSDVTPHETAKAEWNRTITSSIALREPN